MTQTTDAGIEDPGADARPAPRVRRADAAHRHRRAAPSCSSRRATVAVVLWTKACARRRAPAEDRAAAASVAAQFALRMDNVDGTDFDGYIKGVNELLTTKAQDQEQQGLRRDEAELRGGQGQRAPARCCSPASATSTTTRPPCSSSTTPGQDHARATVEHHYRWSVNLVKVKGEWLVDDFNPVN